MQKNNRQLQYDCTQPKLDSVKHILKARPLSVNFSNFVALRPFQFQKEKKQTAVTIRLQIDNTWSKKLFCINLTFRVLQHTFSEVTVKTKTKYYKFEKKARHW